MMTFRCAQHLRGLGGVCASGLAGALEMRRHQFFNLLLQHDVVAASARDVRAADRLGGYLDRIRDYRIPIVHLCLHKCPPRTAESGSSFVWSHLINILVKRSPYSFFVAFAFAFAKAPPCGAGVPSSRTSQPSLNSDVLPRITCSEPSMSAHASSPDFDGTKRLVTSTQSPSLTPTWTSVRTAWPFS